MSVLEKKRFCPIIDSKSIPPTFKRLNVNAIRDFPPNCGPFVRKNDGSREIYPSTTKRGKCGPSFPQKKSGSYTQCPADAEIKSCSNEAMNVVDSAEPLSVFVPSNFDKQDDLAVHPKEAGDSSHLNTSCPPSNGNQMKEENLMYEESTQQHQL